MEALKLVSDSFSIIVRSHQKSIKNLLANSDNSIIQLNNNKRKEITNSIDMLANSIVVHNTIIFNEIDPHCNKGKYKNRKNDNIIKNKVLCNEINLFAYFSDNNNFLNTAGLDYLVKYASHSASY